MFQGNILNPLLFNFVLLELPNAIPGNLNPSLYSDDICLWTSGLAFGQISDNLYVGLHIIVSSMQQRGMDNSPTKKAMLPFRRRSAANIQGSLTAITTSHKLLELIFDRQLT